MPNYFWIVLVITTAVVLVIFRLTAAGEKLAQINKDIRQNDKDDRIFMSMQEDGHDSEDDSADGGEVCTRQLPRDPDGPGSSGGGNNRGLGN